MSTCSAFAQTLRRYTSLNHLAQAARAVLQNSSQITQMLTDLNRVDFANVQVRLIFFYAIIETFRFIEEDDYKEPRVFSKLDPPESCCCCRHRRCFKLPIEGSSALSLWIPWWPWPSTCFLYLVDWEHTLVARGPWVMLEHNVNRVLSRIYLLGEKFRSAEGNKFPRGVQGQAPFEIFWNKYALRCNLVHFETQ